MKKVFLFVLILLLMSVSSPVHASLGFFKPQSRLHVFQPVIESVRLFFTFTVEGKTDYLLELTERRVEEMEIAPVTGTAERYEAHFRKLERLAEKAEDSEGIVERIKEASIRQQETLAGVYAQAPDTAKDAVLSAQEQSSKNIVRAIEAVQGADEANAYAERVGRIQQVGKAARAGQMERALMESAPNANPEESVIRELKESRGTMPIQEGRPLQPILEEQGEGGEAGMEPAAPIEMLQPAPQQ